MITKDEALTCGMFHDNDYRNSDGTCQRWRRNGATKTWKRSPDRWSVPVKRGLYQYGRITDGIAPSFHTEQSCTNLTSVLGEKGT